jgi:hypothetical protein
MQVEERSDEITAEAPGAQGQNNLVSGIVSRVLCLFTLLSILPVDILKVKVENLIRRWFN